MSLDIDTNPARVPKHPAEILDLTFDFSALLPEGVTISTAIARIANFASVDTTSDMLPFAPILDIDNGKVVIRVVRGSENYSYACACMAFLSTGERKVLRTYIDVGQGEFGPNLVSVGVIQQTLSAPIQSISAEVA